jgi:hypothetical protein
MTGDKGPEVLQWSIRPYEKAPGKRYVILLVALLAMALGVFVYGRPLLGILGFAIILGATMDFWLGSSYTVDPKGVSSRTGLSLSRIEWEDAKRILIGPGEVKVSPLERGGGRLDEFRGVVLKLKEENREQVLAAIRKFGGNHARILEG